MLFGCLDTRGRYRGARPQSSAVRSQDDPYLTACHCIYIADLFGRLVVVFQPAPADDVRRLRAVVLLLLATDGRVRLRLSDNAPLHSALIRSEGSSALQTLLPRVGHRPDPMIGRRVSGLDRALRQLAEDGSLVPVSGSRWRASGSARAVALRDLAALPLAVREGVRDLAYRWHGLATSEAQRRGAMRPQDDVA